MRTGTSPVATWTEPVASGGAKIISTILKPSGRLAVKECRGRSSFVCVTVSDQWPRQGGPRGKTPGVGWGTRSGRGASRSEPCGSLRGCGAVDVRREVGGMSDRPAFPFRGSSFGNRPLGSGANHTAIPEAAPVSGPSSGLDGARPSSLRGLPVVRDSALHPDVCPTGR